MSIRPVKRLIKSKPTLEGAGVHLRRAFGFGNTSDFDPFLLLDDYTSPDRRERFAVDRVLEVHLRRRRRRGRIDRLPRDGELPLALVGAREAHPDVGGALPGLLLRQRSERHGHARLEHLRRGRGSRSRGPWCSAPSSPAAPTTLAPDRFTFTLILWYFPSSSVRVGV